MSRAVAGEQPPSARASPPPPRRRDVTILRRLTERPHLRGVTRLRGPRRSGWESSGDLGATHADALAAGLSRAKTPPIAPEVTMTAPRRAGTRRAGTRRAG